VQGVITSNATLHTYFHVRLWARWLLAVSGSVVDEFGVFRYQEHLFIEKGTTNGVSF